MHQTEGAAVPPWNFDGFIDETRGEHDRQVGAPMESHPDFIFGDGDVSRHVDEVAEDLTRLGIVVAAHAAGHEAIEAGSENEERHVEVDLEADR